jgi:ribosomal protein L40E
LTSASGWTVPTTGLYHVIIVNDSSSDTTVTFLLWNLQTVTISSSSYSYYTTPTSYNFFSTHSTTFAPPSTQPNLIPQFFTSLVFTYLIVLIVIGVAVIAFIYFGPWKGDKRSKQMALSHYLKPRARKEPAGQFCLECGSKLPVGSKFCNKCGTKQP